MQSRAIILKRVAYGEADLIVTFFSRDIGRASGIAKNAKKSMRRFGGALEPGSIVDISCSFRSGRNLGRIDETAVVSSMLGAMRSIGRINAVARGVSLALAFLPEYQSAPEKFDLLAKWFLLCNNKDPTPSDMAAFEMNWLRCCGFGPHLTGCVRCGLGLKKSVRWTFDFDQGGVVCPSCRPSGHILAHDTLRVLRRLAEGGTIMGGSLVGVVDRYIDHVLGRPLPTYSLPEKICGR